MKVSVLGSGNGGCAVAFEWASKGHEVYLFDFEQFPQTIKAVQARGGISAKGEMEGFAKIAYAGHDIARVLKDSTLVFVVGPAYATETFAQACKPHVVPGQTYVVCPGSCAGAVVFKNAIGLELGDERVVVAETSTLPYAVRLTGEAEVTIYNRLKGAYFMAALPSRCNSRVYDVLRQCHETIEVAANVFQTTLQNANPIIHPSVMLLNAALTERTGGDFLFYEQGVTQGVGRIIEALDKERIEIGKALSVTIVPDPVLAYKQGYMFNETYDVGFSKAPGFKGIRAPDRLEHRYVNEDCGYGLVFMRDLGAYLGVKTPVMDSMITIWSVIMRRDFRAEGARTLHSLGLDRYTPEQLKNVL